MQNEKIKAPLIIVLTKFDAWLQLTKFPNYYHPWNPMQNSPLNVYNVQRVEQYSQILRRVLLDLIPDLVGTAEANAENVVYIAVSATGTAPELGEPDQDGKRPLLYRPVTVHPEDIPPLLLDFDGLVHGNQRIFVSQPKTFEKFPAVHGLV